MSLSFLIGVLMLFAPFIGLFAFVVSEDGWLPALVIFGGVAAFVGWIFLAASLMT